MNASVSLDDDKRPIKASLEAPMDEWVRFHDATVADVDERGVSRWPTDSQPDSSSAMSSFAIIRDESAGAVTVSLDGRELVATGDGLSLSTFIRNIHFLASPDLFPGSLSDHLHLEHLDSPGYPISAESLPLTIRRVLYSL